VKSVATTRTGTRKNQVSGQQTGAGGQGCLKRNAGELLAHALHLRTLLLVLLAGCKDVLLYTGIALENPARSSGLK
jgi:hypothetical protein